jgi:hypothetical protein
MEEALSVDLEDPAEVPAVLLEVLEEAPVVAGAPGRVFNNDRRRLCFDGLILSIKRLS